MSRNRIAATTLVAVLGLAVLATGVSSAAPGPYDQPPAINLVPKVLNKTRFKLKKVVQVGTESCGTGTCTFTVQKVFAAVRNSNKFQASIIAPSTLNAGETEPIKVKLSGRAYKRLLNSKNGHGHAKFELLLDSSPGYPTVKAAGNARYQAPKKP